MTTHRTPRAARSPGQARRPGAAYFRALIENATDLITVVDAAGIVQYVSPSVTRVIGWNAADLLGHDIFEILHPDEQPLAREIFASFRERPGTGARVEFRVRNPAGEWLTIESVGNNLLDTPAVGAIVYNSRDITASKRAEAGLRRESDFSNALLDSLPGVFYFYNQQLQFLRWNKNFETVTGYTAAEIARMSPLDFFDTDERPLLAERIEEVFSLGVAAVEAHLLTQDRRRLPYYFTGMKTQVDGQTCLIGVGIDITQRQQAEAALRESEERYRRFTEASPYGILVHQDGQVVFANLAAAALLGAAAPADLIGVPIQHLVEPESWLATEARQQRILSGETESFPTDERFRRLDGSSLPVQVITTPFVHDGRPAMQKIIQDITDRQRAQEILAASERRLSLIFETVADVLFLLAVEPPDGYRFVSVNASFLAVTGLTRAQVIDQPIEAVLPPASHTLARGKYQEAIRDNKTVRWEEISVYPTGNLYGEVAVAPAHNADGVITHLIGSVHDITQVRQAEKEIRQLNEALERRVAERTAQLAAANKELESFSYSVSHDLRAPLRAISGFAEIIARRHRDSLNPEGQHYFDNIVQASERMGRLIDDLLNYARLGRQAVRRDRVPLDDLFQALLRDMQARLEASGSTLQLAANLPVVLGDRTLLEQLFGNLLENAHTYRQPGQPARIQVDWQPAGLAAVIRVRDAGIGIPPEYHGKIFDIFQRLHSEDVYPGTGIGLATVKKAADMLGGRVWVESQAGAGSTFFVQLPME